MSCACCDEIVEQLKEERRALQLERQELGQMRQSREYWMSEERIERERKEAAYRRINALRGALTKAKRKIAELKGDA